MQKRLTISKNRKIEICEENCSCGEHLCHQQIDESPSFFWWTIKRLVEMDEKTKLENQKTIQEFNRKIEFLPTEQDEKLIENCNIINDAVEKNPAIKRIVTRIKDYISYVSTYHNLIQTAQRKAFSREDELEIYKYYDNLRLEKHNKAINAYGHLVKDIHEKTKGSINISRFSYQQILEKGTESRIRGNLGNEMENLIYTLQDIKIEKNIRNNLKKQQEEIELTKNDELMR